MRLQRKHMQNLMAFKFQPKVISHFQWKIVLHHHRISKDFSIAQISAIPNTKLLVSLHHSNVQGANLGIFDYSCSKSIKKIFELGDVRGGKYLSCALFLKIWQHSTVTGPGDFTYNPRRNLLGAISIDKQTSYHLFRHTRNETKNTYSVNLLKKAKWFSQSSDIFGNSPPH